jgi:hypothetical protein
LTRFTAARRRIPIAFEGVTIMRRPPIQLLLLTLAMGLSVSAWGKEEATFTTPALTPEAALKAAQAALQACQKAGFNTAVAVADRGGVTQVMIRDRFAGAHTPQTAMEGMDRGQFPHQHHRTHGPDPARQRLLRHS